MYPSVDSFWVDFQMRFSHYPTPQESNTHTWHTYIIHPVYTVHKHSTCSIDEQTFYSILIVESGSTLSGTHNVIRAYIFNLRFLFIFSWKVRIIHLCLQKIPSSNKIALYLSSFMIIIFMWATLFLSCTVDFISYSSYMDFLAHMRWSCLHRIQNTLFSSEKKSHCEWMIAHFNAHKYQKNG